MSSWGSDMNVDTVVARNRIHGSHELLSIARACPRGMVPVQGM